MSRKKKLRRAPTAQRSQPTQSAAAVAPNLRRAWWFGATIALLVIGGGLFYWYSASRSNSVSGETDNQTAPLGVTYVGAKVCAECHVPEYEAWNGSQHALAMQHADAQTVLGNFADGKISYAGVTSTFFTRAGKYFVNTEGADGKLADFEIKYTFGVYPLQQYLVEFPDGRILVWLTAWDARPKKDGGQ